MTKLRHDKVEAIAKSLPPLEVDDPDGDARVLVMGWGSTYGPVLGATRRAREAGTKVARIHLRHINPLPADLGDILARYDRVLLPENNSGQLAMLLRARFLKDITGYNRVTGQPLRAGEIAEQITALAATLEVPA